jgi:transcriptional regulator with AAA-type ATPase domain/tetratricopeptide (TPR) repeat protein
MRDVLGASPAIEALRANIGRLMDRARRSPRLLPVLIQGETGTGKGLLAEVLHRTGPRAGGPFVAVNCAAIPEGLLEAELFGFERGAFTDAKQAKPGLFQTAHRGVLFLDEVGLLPAALQAKLLNAIEEGSVRRLGSTRSERVDVWIISASNVDLRAAILERRFREDLYQRLAGLTLSLPPLRERGEDVIMLAEHYLAQASSDFSLPPRTLTPEARARLLRYRWPGNVRELASLMERSALLSDTPRVTAATLDLKETPVTEPSVAPRGPGAGAASLDEAMRDHLQAVLDQTGGNISHTAAILGIARNTLRSRIRKLGLKGPRPVAPPSAAREGAPLAAPDHAMEPEVTPAPRSTAVRWERRHVTLLRVALAATADESLLAGHLVSLAVEKILGFGGRIEALGQTWLDASFGALPIENGARRAASAALAFHKAVLEAGRPGFAGTTLIHTEQTTVGQVGDIIAIDDAQRAVLGGTLDRMAQHASPGLVHASGMTAPFLVRHFELRGDERPGADGESAFIVVRPDPSGLGAWRRLTRFVGRQLEMDVLRSRGELASRGRGQVIGLVGEPGVGKSRLVWEFLHEGPDRGWLVLETVSATPGRPAPFFAVIDMLRFYFDVFPGEAKDSIRDKIARRLALVDETLLRSLPVFLTLFDVPADDAGWQILDPSERRRQILAGIKRLMLRESARQPLVLVFEDAHWADGETRELLDEIADSVPVAHVLMLVTYRPEYQHGWTSRSFYTHLRVEPLRGESADRLVDELLGVDASLDELRPLLIQWTDGNPFFIEEVVRTLGETGALRGEHGTYRLTRALDGIVVPGTVEEVLASRISRLGPGPAGLLRAAAVVGRQVPYAVLAAVSREAPEALDTHLHDLQSAEFLYEGGDSEEREYMFRHALTQEVAYASLTDEQRCGLHSRAMDALLAVYADREDEKISELAHHAFSGRVWERAAGYLRRAGRRAFARSINREAVECFTRALVALSHLPRSRAFQEEAIDVRFDLRGALWPLGEVDNMGKVLAEAGDLAQELNDERRQGLAAVANCHYFFIMSRHADAVAAGEEALAMARATGNHAIERDATLYMGIVHGAMGSYGRAVELLQANLSAYEVAYDRLSARERVVSRPTARTYVARYLAELGELRQAADHASTGMRAAEPGASPWLLATCYFGVASVELRRGDFPAAISSLERAVEMCRSHHLQSWFPAAAASLGYAYTNAGRATEGLALLEQAVAHADLMHVSASYSMWLTYLGHAQLCLGRAAEAQRTAEAAIERARERGERGHEAWALLLLASAKASSGSAGAEAIEKMFEPAIDQARSLGMRPLLAYCHAALADASDRLGSQERAAEARGAAQQIQKEIGMITTDHLL